MHSTKWFYWQEKTLFIHIYLQPRASRDEIVGLHGDCLKIRITAPPVDNQANEYLIKFLAATFAVTQKQIVIEKGHTGRKKLIKIDSPKNTGILNEDRFRK